jgi:hypothetical protein
MRDKDMKTPIKEAILLQLEKPISDLTARIIESEKAIYLEKVGKELNMTPWMEEMIRLSLVIDLMKALQNYILPTDELVGLNWYSGPKGIEISAGIEREGVRYLFVTEAITAGGYNIQRFHYRYIVKSKMPRVSGGLATEYQNKYKTLSKIEKLEKEIENYQNKINEYQQRIDELTPMSKEELIVELGNHTMLGWRVKNDYKWENIDQTYYKGTKEEWEAEQRKLVEDGVIEMLNWDVNRPKRYIKDFEKKIVKLQAKIETLK